LLLISESRKRAFVHVQKTGRNTVDKLLKQTYRIYKLG
jgi:hypothetical protein